MHLFISILIPLVAGFWVYLDAKEKGRTDEKALLWGCGTFLLLIVFLPLWFFYRNSSEQRENVKQCPGCRRFLQNMPWASYCPYCGSSLIPDKLPPESHQETNELKD